MKVLATVFLTMVAGCLLILFLVAFAIGGGRQSRRVSTPAPVVAHQTPKTQPQRDEKLIAERAAFVQKLCDKGIFKHVDSDGENVVGPAWFGIDFELKQKFASVIMAWRLDHDPDAPSVRFNDPMTGKRLGTYDVHYGLRMD